MAIFRQLAMLLQVEGSPVPGLKLKSRDRASNGSRVYHQLHAPGC
jgi:hypothetical protein